MATYRGLRLKLGVKTIKNNLPELPGEIEDALDRIVRKGTLDIEGWATLLVARDTGTLANAIHSLFPRKLHGVVSVAGVDYAAYNEYGTVYWAGQPFLFPAAEKVRPSFVAAAKQELAKVGQ